MEARYANAARISAGCVVGLAAGMVVGTYRARRAFDARLDAEVADLKEHYRNHPPGVAINDAILTDEELAPLADSLRIAGAAQAEAARIAETVRPEVLRDLTVPHIISAEEFSDFDPASGWQQLTITFYAADGVLVDDKEQPIRDMINTTGMINRLSFGGVSLDPAIMFIRNPRLEVEFEVVLDSRSYADVVLNYGNPDRKDR
jgi:hypothetical protein